MKIGVLALQGAFIEHIRKLAALGIAAPEVRLPRDLQGLDGLIIPGGESTAIGKLISGYGLTDPLREFAGRHALWGTCAGMIVMAKEIEGEQPLLGLMEIAVERNAFGRQIDSFEAPLTVAELAEGAARPFPGIFIRAPRLVHARGPARVLARLTDGTAVAAVEGRWLATAFHPELSADLRFHKYFVEMTKKDKG
jgi:5'-phosphate synthase pdxT subunit